MRHEILRSRRAWLAASVVTGIAIASIVPWSTSVSVPSVIEAARTERIYPETPSRIDRVFVQSGQTVKAGDRLIDLAAPQVDKDLRTAAIKLDMVSRRIARAATDATDRAQISVLQREHQLLSDEISGLERLRSRLSVRAPFDGTIVDVDQNLHAGRWVSRQEKLMTVVDRSGDKVRGYLSESDLWRIENGAEGAFIPDDIQRSDLPVVVAGVSVANSPVLEIDYLASSFGGRVAVRSQTEGELTPIEPQYLVSMQLLDDQAGDGPVLRGLVKLEGKPESLLARFWRRTLQVLVRESGV